MSCFELQTMQTRCSFRGSFFLILSLALIAGNVACDQLTGKKKPANDTKSEQAAGSSGGSSSGSSGGGTGSGSKGRDEERKKTDLGNSVSDDVSSKLTSEERKLLKDFACKYKSNPSKIAKFSKMVKNSDDKQTIKDLSSNYDEDKVNALMTLAKALNGSDTKTKATLKTICSGSSSSNAAED